MWSAQFTIRNEDSIYTRLTVKHKVTDQFYPVNFHRRGKIVLVMGIHYIVGEPAEKDAFARDLKKHPKTVRFERHGDTIMLMMKEEEPFYDLMYDPELYNPTPAIIKNGYESWLAVAWERKILEKLITEIGRWKKKFPEFKLHSIQKTSLGDIYFPQFVPNMAPKQKLAFQLAVEHGYYSIPRTSTLKDLAKMMKISLSTYQEHLRKAEASLIPFFGKSSYMKPEISGSKL